MLAHMEDDNDIGPYGIALLLLLLLVGNVATEQSIGLSAFVVSRLWAFLAFLARAAAQFVRMRTFLYRTLTAVGARCTLSL